MSRFPRKDAGAVLASEVACAWALVTGPDTEPITLAHAKQQARITDESSNGLLESYIKAAREEAESYLGRGLYTQIWRLTLDGFASVMPLPMAAPIQVATIDSVAYPKVEYYDADGVLQTLATSVYDTDTASRPARIVLKPGQNWPTVQSERLNGRVVITYAVGWASVADIPETIKQGIRMYVTYLDLDRDGMEDLALKARQAAERCWGDRVAWTPPVVD